MTRKNNRVAVAMSGGVDSSVAAALLKEQGYEVIGLTMQLLESPADKTENNPNDPVKDARRVAESLEIPFHAVNFEDEFRQLIVDSFCKDYFLGRTPNPCVLCNMKVKFDLLLKKAMEMGADFLATGHYARIYCEEGVYFLRKGAYLSKDQSYFLFALGQEQLSRVLFPLGDMTKEQVREHASRFGLTVAEKAESQDICFIPDGDYVRFLEQRHRCDDMDGDIVHISGQVLGRHQGTFRYTIGQRRGLGIAWKQPLYVVGIDAVNKRVLVGEREHLAVKEFKVQNTIWSIPEPEKAIRTFCRIRYRHREVPATVTPICCGRVSVCFDEPQQGVTPGQAAVFYDGDRVLGGGWIE